MSSTTNNDFREIRRNRNVLNTMYPLYMRSANNRNNLGIQSLYIRNRNNIQNSHNDRRYMNIILEIFKEYNNIFQIYQTNYNTQNVLVQNMQNPQEIHMEYEINNKLYHKNIKKILDLIEQSHNNTINSGMAPTQTTNPTTDNILNQSTTSTTTTPTSTNTNTTNDPLTNDLWRNIFPFYIIEPISERQSSTPPATSSITIDEVNQYIEYITYDQEQNESDRCPISHDNFIEGESICKIKNCGHTFKIQHLLSWLRINTTCPVCRSELRPSVPTTPPTPSQNSLEPDSDVMLLINEVIRNINISTL